MDGPLDPLTCLSRKTTARRIREREKGGGRGGVRPSHPDAANLLPASHVNRYTIVWSAACFARSETRGRGDKQAETEQV